MTLRDAALVDRPSGDEASIIRRDTRRDPERAGLTLPNLLAAGAARRAFLYARYNADLSRAGLDAMGLSDIDPDDVQKLDSVAHIDDLRRVGRKVAEAVRPEHFGSSCRDETRTAA